MPAEVQPLAAWRARTARDDHPTGGMCAITKPDTDGDGAIPRHEFIRAVREHFLSNDPDAPGSMFFGHI